MPRHRVRTAHRMPGRIRLKLDGSSRKAHELEDLKRTIASMPGVDRVEANLASGSLVIHYDPKLYGRFHHQLKEHGDSTGTFHLDVPDIGEGADLIKSVEEEADFLAEHSETARVMVNGFRSLDRAIRRATDNTVDLKVLLPLGLAVYSFVEIGLEAATPLWITLGIFSFNSFVQLHSPKPGGARSKRALREALAEAQHASSATP
ncbi:MAG TPA: hypothetical protein VFB14_14450 [Bryobacteraceae bacterium]|nr:hypothetical protein [Bryobacteraceae bacterium]